jgi:alanine-synthesizing transaminase
VLSTRTLHDPTPNALSLALRAARASGRPVLDLTVSNPTTAGVPYDTAEILRAFADARALTYEPEAFGLPSAREAVARELSVRGTVVDPARVVLTASTSEAYSFLFKVLCDAGDDVLVPQPSYPLFDHLAAFEGVRLVPYELSYDGAWHLDADTLRRAVTPRTRAILSVSPNNPTGSYLKKSELAAMASLGLPIVSDEVFATYPLRDDPERAWTALEASGVLVFAMGGLSKMAALPQMKLAWTVVAGPERLVADALARLELVADSFLSVGAPVQHALPALLASRNVASGAILARVRKNLDVVRRALKPTSAVTLLDVEGGWNATLRVPRTQSDEAWALELLAKDGVYVHPGHFFDFPREGHLIVSLLTPEAELADGVARIVARVDGDSQEDGTSEVPPRRGPQ